MSHEIAVRILEENSQWAIFMHSRFYTDVKLAPYCKVLSFWSGIREVFETLSMDVQWIIVDHSDLGLEGQ